MSLMLKRVFCSFCGRELAQFAITIADNAHVNKLPLGMVCDLPCARGTVNEFGPQDFVQEKKEKKEDLKCPNCGGSMHNGICGACSTLRQFTNTQSTRDITKLTYSNEGTTELD